MKKKFMKRLLVLALSGAMVLGTSGFASAAQSGTSSSQAGVSDGLSVAEETAGAEQDAPEEEPDPAAGAQADAAEDADGSEETSAAEEEGTLTQDSEGYYLISSGDDMDTFASMVLSDATICGRLTQNITLNSTYVPIGLSELAESTSSVTLTAYTGTFDGSGFTISGLAIDQSSSSTGKYYYAALFAELGDGGTIRDLTVEGSVTAYNYSSGVVAYALGGTIENVTSNVTLTSNSYTGGIVAYNKTNPVTVTNCVNYGTITTSSSYTAVL